MVYGDDGKLGEDDKILLLMHNLSLVHREIAWTSLDIAKNASISEDYLISVLKQLEARGYVRSFSDADGSKKYYLTGVGIIKISTEFT
jgi:hypothetical protein